MLVRKLRGDPNNAQLRRELGELYFSSSVKHNTRSSLDAAIVWFENALRLDPRHARTWYLLARSYDMQGGPDASKRALDALKCCVIYEPLSARYWASLGVIHMQRGEVSNAIAAYERAGKDHHACMSLGQVWQHYGTQLKDVGERERWYLAREAYNNAFECAQDQEQLDAAREKLDEVDAHLMESAIQKEREEDQLDSGSSTDHLKSTKRDPSERGEGNGSEAEGSDDAAVQIVADTLPLTPATREDNPPPPPPSPEEHDCGGDDDPVSVENEVDTVSRRLNLPDPFHCLLLKIYLSLVFFKGVRPATTVPDFDDCDVRGRSFGGPAVGQGRWNACLFPQ
jgi:tetratricopeptide (TPR) repeat protein